ncbi:transmembrane protein 200C-like [Fundulus diaphanus]
MIATGGLLRINARRQDSLRSKAHRPHPHKKKNKNKRRSEVVVVKGKLKLCSVPGLVAVLGILVLLVGVLMAALGYWPRDGLFFSSQPQEGAAMALKSFSSPTPALAGVQEETRWEEPERGDRISVGGDGGEEENGFNQTEVTNGTTQHLPQGFLEDFLERYLYSDSLKVFGPLIMGIGIFLFICANAVLHENRDKKTKVINLRDIYSTVIDLHSVRKPHPSSGSTHQPSANPLNGIINYVQSRSLESKSRACPVALLSSRPPPSSRGSSDEGGGPVFSIYQQQPHASPPSSSHGHSLPQTYNPCWTSHHKEVLSSFTLPRPRQRSPGPRRRHSFWAGNSQEEEDQKKKQMQPPPLCASTPPPHGGSEALLLLSSSSLSSLSHLLSSSSSTPVPPCRRRSLPTAAFNTAYSELTQGGNGSSEWSSSYKVTPEGRAQHSLKAAHRDGEPAKRT